MTTRDQYNQMIAALEAAREGKIIEFRFADRGQHSDGWLVLKKAGWDFNRYEYRTAPEPKPPRWVAWTFETCPRGALWVVTKDVYKTPELLITCIYTYGIIFQDACNSMNKTWEQLFAGYVQLDGSPCGTLVKEEGE